MKNFKKEINKFYSQKSSIDSHIWNVFYRYIKEEHILFSGPDGWDIHEDGIYFYGEDGCMGCYDRMSLVIPEKFFTDTENSFAQLIEEKEQKKKQDEENKRLAKEQKELSEFKRLQEKYGESK